jgi:hypothetical protein
MTPASNADTGEQSQGKHWLDKLAVALSGCAFLAAGVAAGFTGYQACIARDTEHRQLQAFITANKIQVITYGAKLQGQPEWVISAIIENTGNTPTRNLKLSSTTGIGPSKPFVIQDNFHWNDDSALKGIGLIGPKSEVFGPGYLTGAGDLAEISAGRMRVEMAGVATYEDIFGASHRTEFCFAVALPPVEYLSYPIGQAIRSTPSFCPRHNCADDECSAD